MIISASRRTDIPAFYASWFFNRLKEGFVLVPNPRNPNQVRHISLSPNVVDCFVFWTKNPSPMLNNLQKLSAYPFYFQFTLTAYQHDIEPHLPDLDKRLAIFKRLAEQIGSARIIWRYDPILFNARYTMDYHIHRFNYIASSLQGYTDTCVISFLDEYTHLKKTFNKQGINTLPLEAKLTLCKALSGIAANNQLTIQTCAEDVNLTPYNIEKGACIDKARIERITGRTLSAKVDQHQRSACQCIESVDIGTYNTCLYGCVYCYAITSKYSTKENIRLHNKCSPKLVGLPCNTDQIKEKTMQSLFVSQCDLFL